MRHLGTSLSGLTLDGEANDQPSALAIFSSISSAAPAVKPTTTLGRSPIMRASAARQPPAMMKGAASLAPMPPPCPSMTQIRFIN